MTDGYNDRYPSLLYKVVAVACHYSTCSIRVIHQWSPEMPSIGHLSIFFFFKGRVIKFLPIFSETINTGNIRNNRQAKNWRQSGIKGTVIISDKIDREFSQPIQI
jgi:hypothetical protein